MVREKKLKDGKVSGREDEIIDLLLATGGSENVKKISTASYLREFEELTYEEIVKKNIRPKKKKKKKDLSPRELNSWTLDWIQMSLYKDTGKEALSYCELKKNSGQKDDLREGMNRSQSEGMHIYRTNTEYLEGFR